MRTEQIAGLRSVREVFALVWPQAAAYVRGRLVAALLLITLTSALTAVGPLALKQIVDGLTGTARATAASATVWIGLYVLSQWLARSVGEIRGLVYARAERRMSRTLSERVFAHVLRLPLRWHLERQTGAVTQALSNGVSGYQTVLHTLIFSVLPVATELGTIVLVLARLGQATFLWLFCVAIVCYAAVFTYAAHRTRKAGRNASAAQVEATGTMTDSILNYETIKYFAAEDAAERRVQDALLRTEHEWVQFFRQYAVNGVLVATIYATFLGATIVHASAQVRAGQITIGTFVLVNTYMLQILRPVEMLGYAVQSLTQGVAYLEKLMELLREKREAELSLTGQAPGSGTTEMRRTPARSSPGFMHPRGELEFRDVHLSYGPDRPILKGVSFRVPAGHALGIVGESGSGKSTIVRLLARLLEPDRGTIFLDGVPVQQLSLTALRQSVAVVPQDTVLFNESIGYNIAFGRPECAQDDIEQAARLANLHDFILSLPQRYETRVGERGVKLSGGERQRVSIARAALKRPVIYVADEATSSLDSRTEREIVRNLQEVARHTTTLMIAHRLSTVVHADTIIVLEAGVVAESGTHQMLLRQNGRYAALWRAQAGMAAA